jgi:Mce-associated membrane protein
VLGTLRRSRWTPIVLVVLLGALLVFEAVQLDLIGGNDAEPEPSPAAVGLTRRFATAVTSFDHKRLDADIARVLALGTPGFEREFRSAMGADFAQRIAANKTVSSGHIVAGPRAQRIAEGLTTFLVVVDQQVTSEGGKEQPQVIRVGLLVTVDKNGQKVTKVEVL